MMRIGNVQLRQAVFLDRDGTIIEDRGYLSDPAEVQFVPGTISALRRLQQEFFLFIVTNQAGVAEGITTHHDVNRVNEHVVRYLAEHGVKISAVYVCPHRRSDGCPCIKPNPHFLSRAAEEFGLDLRRSFVVGDHPHDVELADRAGAQGVYVCTGHGLKHLAELPSERVVVPEILAAAEWILARCRTSRKLRGGECQIADAADALRCGRVVAFLTETACNAQRMPVVLRPWNRCRKKAT